METKLGSEMWVLEGMDTLWFHQIILCNHFSTKNSFSQISSPLSVVTTSSQVDSSSEESDYHPYHKEMSRTRLNSEVSRKMRYQSSSPTSTKKQSRTKLEKTRSLGDLELEEVKGFMDLGFIFKKDNLSRRMMRLIPGLKRLINIKDHIEIKDEEIMRPYLSEAWRPDCSPLINVRIEEDCSASDMKKILKSWARTVALINVRIQ